jgi:3-oxoacyl-[acyl-carrier-protein] synthase-3
MSGIFIAGTGMYAPQRVVTNDDLAKIVDTSDEWITERTGIKQRRFSEGEPNFYMGKHAALEAIGRAGVDPAEIDLIIGSTVTPDYYCPSLACIIQSEIGAEKAFCWDLNAACSGFIYALDVAQTYLAAGKVKTVLIVCSEVLSKITDFTDRASCVLFGDGAGAVVVKKSDGLYASYLRSEGKSGGSLISRTPKNHSPYVTHAENEEFYKYKETKDSYLAMDGREVYRFATKALSESIVAACEKAGLSVAQLSLIVPHQANIRIIKTAAERLGVDMDKMFVNLDRYGNTSCASIPICLAELDSSGRLHRGDRIALGGFGAGLTCGAIVMEW